MYCIFLNYLYIFVLKLCFYCQVMKTNNYYMKWISLISGIIMLMALIYSQPVFHKQNYMDRKSTETMNGSVRSGRSSEIPAPERFNYGTDRDQGKYNDLINKNIIINIL